MQISAESSMQNMATGRPMAKWFLTPLLIVAIAGAWMGQSLQLGGFGLVVSDNVANAKGGNGGGNGNSGGHGGGNGASAAGRGGGHGGAGRDGSRGAGGEGRGHAHSEHAHTGHAHSGHGHSGHGHGKASRHGVSASTLGSLNAAHASPTARANAAPNSAVAAIAAFVGALESEELSDRQRIEAAAEALASRANKPITTPVVAEVANLSNVQVSRREARAIAQRAAHIQNGGQ